MSCHSGSLRRESRLRARRGLISAARSGSSLCWCKAACTSGRLERIKFWTKYNRLLPSQQLYSTWNPSVRAAMGQRSRENAGRDFNVAVIEARYRAALDGATVFATLPRYMK